MSKIAQMIYDEHPDDKASREQAEKSAATVIDRFLKNNPAIARELILTYADADAQRKLREYREDFWSNIP